MTKFDLTTIDGRRPYIRSLYFILQKAVSELFPNAVLLVDYNLPNGVYCELKGQKIDDAIISEIKARMHHIVDQDYPITNKVIDTKAAISIFEKNGQPQKAALARTMGHSTMRVDVLGDRIDNFYGPQLDSTGQLKVFDIVRYGDGMCLLSPDATNPTTVPSLVAQDKIYSILKDHSNWLSILGVNSIGTLNEALLRGRSKELIQLSEIRQENKYEEIASMIASRRDQVKLILIAGPSSSGKTTTSKRLALHLRVNGMNPVVIEMDNYFVNREDTPKDEEGNYDYECVKAVDIDFLTTQLKQLFSGEEVEIPKFDFSMGKRVFVGNKLKMGPNDVLIMEGIHGLNPEFTAGMPADKIFKIYASALTSLSIDENMNISTSDNRIIRRIVRDNKYRGVSAESTIMRWTSVRAGEIKNIFGYQENADVMFNSALIYELPLLKCYAEPLLRDIKPDSPAFPEALRLLNFLRLIIALTPDEVSAVPPTSLLREFIGGSSIEY